MRVPDAIRECVCFIGMENERGQFSYGGTAFFVSIPFESTTERQFHYLVTAKHCIQSISERGRNVVLRLNTRDDRAQQISIPATRWVLPEDDAVDLAVLRCAPPTETFDYLTLPADLFASDEVISEHDIGIGEDLVITGLFTEHVGKSKNLPILRRGTLAAMPEEPLVDDYGRDYFVYLIEVRSIGGLSGSPVFAVIGPVRQGSIHVGRYEFLLLGIIRGHWDLEKKPRVDVSILRELDQVNMGIAMATPARELVALLEDTDLKKERDAIERQWLESQAGR